MLRHALIVLAACALAATTAAAESKSKKGGHGGSIVESHGHPIEFVSKDREITFYIGDHDGAPVSTKGMTGRATVQEAGKTVTVQLTPAEPNRLVGTLAAPLAAKARVVLSTKLHDHTLTARYVNE